MSLDDDLVRYTVSWVREGGELEYINHFKLARCWSRRSQLWAWSGGYEVV